MEKGELEYITLTDSADTETIFCVLGRLSLNGKDYIALENDEDDSADEVVILIEGENGSLYGIEDINELNAVYEAFVELLDRE